MIATILSLPLIALVLAVGLFVPWLGLKFELMHRAEQRYTAQLTEQARIIQECEATIEAYRELVASDTSYTLPPLSPSPDRWNRLALAAQGV